MNFLFSTDVKKRISRTDTDFVSGSITSIAGWVQYNKSGGIRLKLFKTVYSVGWHCEGGQLLTIMLVGFRLGDLHGFTSTCILGWSLFPAPGETPCVVLNYLKLDRRLVHQRIHYVYALLTLKIHGNFVIIARIIRLVFLLSPQESDTLSISVHSPLKAICIWWCQWRYWFIDGWWRWELCNQWSLVLWPLIRWFYQLLEIIFSSRNLWSWEGCLGFNTWSPPHSQFSLHKSRYW